MTRRKSGFERIEAEIRGEIANALGRTGARLVEQIQEAERLEPQISTAEGEERARLIAKHESARHRAEELRQHLIIQREAMGLRDHRLVYATYLIPRRIH